MTPVKPHLPASSCSLTANYRYCFAGTGGSQNHFRKGQSLLKSCNHRPDSLFPVPYGCRSTGHKPGRPRAAISPQKGVIICCASFGLYLPSQIFFKKQLTRPMPTCNRGHTTGLEILRGPFGVGCLTSIELRGFRDCCDTVYFFRIFHVIPVSNSDKRSTRSIWRTGTACSHYALRQGVSPKRPLILAHISRHNTSTFC